MGEAVQNVLAGKQQPKEALDETAQRWTASIAKAKPSFAYEEIAGV
jgi:maltose-binding protein MalE